jgi:hypothetical protein
LTTAVVHRGEEWDVKPPDWQRLPIPLTTVTTVTLVGAGACAFEPQRDDAGAPRLQPMTAAVAVAVTGANAAPGPDQSTDAIAARSVTDPLLIGVLALSISGADLVTL